MTTDSPVAVLFNSDGYEVNVNTGVAIPTGTTGIIAAGSDGTNSRFISVDFSGRPIIVGAGTAGSPVGGVVSIQGVTSGTPIPISGSVTAANASIGITGAAIPASATQIGGSDGTNLQVPMVFDQDSGGGTQYVLGVGLRKSASGGSVEFGTNADPIRIDPTGTTTQPISVVSLPLPTGAATETTLTGILTTTAFQARINTLGQKTMTNSTPVVLASDQSAIPITDNAGSLTIDNPTLSVFGGGTEATALRVTIANDSTGVLSVDDNGSSLTVDGTVTANAGTGNFNVIGTASDNSTNSTSKLPVLSARANTSAPTWTDGNQAPLSVDTSGALRVTGTITANNASVSTTGTSPPASATYIAGSVTTAAPTYTTGQLNALSLTTGGLLRVDNSGVTQTVSGTIAATQSGTWTVQPGNTANTTPWLTTISQGGNAASVSASNALKVDGSAVTQPVSGTVTSNQGTAASLANAWSTKITDTTNGPVAVKAASTAAIDTDPALVVAISPNNTTFIRDRELATFTALATGIALGNNKSMFSIQNTTGSTVKCRIHEIYLINVQTAGVTGVITTFELRRATSHAAGTAITAIEKMETTDTLNSSITVRTNATITGESATLLWRSLWSSDDWGPGALDTESNDHSIQTMFPVYSKKNIGYKPIILNANETLTIKCATNTTAGTFDLMVVFTQE